MSPIFIGGAARSGTTVFAVQLGARLGYSVLPEAYFLAPSLSHERATGISAGLQPAWRLRTWELADLDFQWIQSAPSVREAWDRALQSRGVDRGRGWIEHSPHNLRYCAVLLAAFPTARFVHLVRDGRAVAASIRRTDFGPHTAASIARWWAESVAFGMAAERQFPDRVRVARFEDFVMDPDGVLKELSDWMGVPSAGDPARTTQPLIGAYTRRDHRLVEGEIRADRRDRWQHELRANWVSRFEQVAGPVLEAFGYELMGDPQEAPGQLSRALDPVIDSAVQLGFKAPRRRWRRWKHAR